MKNLVPRFLIIGVVSLLAVLAILARGGLERGIDLSGGTILVYEVNTESLPSNFRMEDLINALKERVNPQGLYDIAIRQAGRDRIEIIMPSTMAAESETVKRKLEQEGALQFRILASANPIAKMPSPLPTSLRRPDPDAGQPRDRLPDPPSKNYGWAKLGELFEGEEIRSTTGKLAGDGTQIVDAGKTWPQNRFRGLRLTAKVKTADGKTSSVTRGISGNRGDTITLDGPIRGESLESYQVDYSTDSDRIVDPVRRWVPNRYSGSIVRLSGLDTTGQPQVVDAEIASNTLNELVLVRPHGLSSVTGYLLGFNPSGLEDGTRLAANYQPIIRRLRVPNQPGVSESYALYINPKPSQDVTGEDLDYVYPTQDDEYRSVVGFNLDRDGSRKFGSLTGDYRPREGNAFEYLLAIVLDGTVMSAPGIQDRITDRGIIRMGGSGQQAMEEVKALIDILNAGSLPASVKVPPLQEETIGPTLGEDTIRKGLWAIGISMLIVPVFMIYYYRVAGVVAVIGLVLNMLLLVGSLALMRNSLTLPGLAGLALTIGMAVDANVLIFERMREEREKGASLAQQIRNGFDRAWTTIFDSNVTTVLSGAVLLLIGTEEVKGFAIVLIVGLVWNLFTSVFVSRTLLEWLHQNGWIKDLRFQQWLANPRINFIGYRNTAIALSLVLITLGLGMFAARGGFRSKGDMYNIDFTGGTLVTVRLDPSKTEGMSDAQRANLVRETAGGVVPNATVERLSIVDGGIATPRYNIRTTEPDAKTVQQSIAKAFGDRLERLSLSYTRDEKAEANEAARAAAETKDAPSSAQRVYTLTLNFAQPPSSISRAIADQLQASGMPAPNSRFQLENPTADPNNLDAKATTLVLRTDLEPAEAEATLAALKTSLSDDPDFLFERVENFGSVVAGETRTKAVYSIIASWLIMIAYLWFRFKSVGYGFAAVIALVHDVLIALGAVAVTGLFAKFGFFGGGYKIDLPMIAAFLTLIGFSVNDTIVIFDRIRELKGKSPTITPQLINDAINVTLSRTILTTLTALIVVVILYAFGGEGLASFAFCLMIGFISGTYSTVYIAAPILIEWLGPGKGKTAKAGAEKDAILAS